MSTWSAWAEREGAAIRDAGQWREPRSFDGGGPTGTIGPAGAPVVSFASNDYLGLTQHPDVVAAAHTALDRWGAGSGSARLIVGARPIHDELERALADWKGADRAVLFPTGFAANLGVLTTLGAPDVLVCSDELNHASIIDGCRLSRASTAVYRHGDVEHLDRLLARREQPRALVVSDTVFSMDGDIADLDGLAAVVARHRALLVLDEAHAVLGPEYPASGFDGVDAVRVGTLSKTLGSLGGFVVASEALAALIVNRARSYIFTTASTPADTAAALAAVRVLTSSEGEALVARLRAHVERVRAGHPSPIVPILCGEERAAVDAANALLARGLLVPAIRPPTVAPGTARLRVALSAAHTDAQIDALIAALADLAPLDVHATTR
ncbi:MAG TPA: 8-amino-7-oxononanoate synthase [Acidimicrobiia bacterium]|jgi:8-amino-7-oxononanoate synthase|nr:8-amino-7-oxononanoate synthase [Acidimicrobiia bacterium]